MHVRLYQDSDQQAVIALWNEVLPDSAPHNDPATAIRKKLAVERDLFFVAEAGGAVLGNVIGGYDGHRGWVYSVAVRPQQRGQRIGSRLIQRLVDALAASWRTSTSMPS
jgi:predicted N-acetyltransferase YhbS